MDTANLKLNDFAVFDRLIFNSKQPDLSERRLWKSWTANHLSKDKWNLDIPIDHFPRTITEYQFCHYVFWMAIWAEKLHSKPLTTYKDGTLMTVTAQCFACAYQKEEGICVCPIKVWQPCKCVYGSDYNKWRFLGNNDAAYRIAHLEWGVEWGEIQKEETF